MLGFVKGFYVCYTYFQVDEIPGLSQIYHQINGYQDLFRNLDNAGIDLENIVYYKDKTHYFVMTAKKASLLKRRVFKEVCINSFYSLKHAPACQT